MRFTTVMAISVIGVIYFNGVRQNEQSAQWRAQQELKTIYGYDVYHDFKFDCTPVPGIRSCRAKGGGEWSRKEGWFWQCYRTNNIYGIYGIDPPPVRADGNVASEYRMKFGDWHGPYSTEAEGIVAANRSGVDCRQEANR